MAEEKYDAKSLKLYMKVASNAEGVSPITSYFLISYTVNKAVDLLKAQRAKGQEDPELTKDVQDWFQKLDELKMVVGGELQDREACKKAYYEYAYSVFLKADNKYRDDNYSVQLAQEFFNATTLLDGYNIFGPVNNEIATHKKYAKVARLKIMKAIKSGNLPVPKSSQQPAETDIPDEEGAGINTTGNFKPHQSIINKGNPNVPTQDFGFNEPYNYKPAGNPYTASNATDQTDATFTLVGQGQGQAQASGLPDFTKFGNFNSNPVGGFGQDNQAGLPDFTKIGNAGTGAYGNANVGGGYPGVPAGYPGTQTGPVVQPEKSKRPRRGPDFYQKAGKAQDFCKKAVAELEYKRLRQFKENLLSALELLEEIDPEGN